MRGGWNVLEAFEDRVFGSWMWRQRSSMMKISFVYSSYFDRNALFQYVYAQCRIAHTVCRACPSLVCIVLTLYFLKDSCAFLVLPRNPLWSDLLDA